MKIFESHIGNEIDYMSLYTHGLDIRLGLSTCKLDPLVHNSYSWTIFVCSLTTIFVVPHWYSLSVNLEVLILRNWFYSAFELARSGSCSSWSCSKVACESQRCLVLVPLELQCPIVSNPRACGSILTCDSKTIRGSTVGLLGLTLMMGLLGLYNLYINWHMTQGPIPVEKGDTRAPLTNFLC